MTYVELLLAAKENKKRRDKASRAPSPFPAKESKAGKVGWTFSLVVNTVYIYIYSYIYINNYVKAYICVYIYICVCVCDTENTWLPTKVLCVCNPSIGRG